MYFNAVLAILQALPQTAEQTKAVSWHAVLLPAGCQHV